MKLTEEQQHIVHHPGGHARVSAVAGSGKTTTMVARIGHLLRQGVAKEQLLVLMFNKSARDAFHDSMTRNLVWAQGGLPEVRTFHSLGLRLVTSFTRRGALPAYRLVTEEYVTERLARQVVNEVYKEEEDGEGWPPGEDVEEFLSYIDRVKATVLDAGLVFEESRLPSRYRYFVKAYDLFEQVRREQKIRFYADLIHEPIMAMRADSSLAAWVSDRVDHIIIDEYQDINEAQQQLLKIVAGTRAKVMVVGDVDQCIYEWRGAQPEYITTRFQQDFLSPVNYLLSHTFRFGHQLSLAANHLIGNNRKRDRKLCISHSTTPKTQLLCVPEQNALRKSRASKGDHPILQVLGDWQAGGRSLTEAVVLVRLFAQSVPVELALLEAGIPYRLEGNNQVFDCPEILALTGYLHLALGALGENDHATRKEILKAMLAQPHVGVKREELELLAEALAKNPGAEPEVLRNWGARGQLPPFIGKRLSEKAEIWRAISVSRSLPPAGELLQQLVVKLDLYDFYETFSARAATAENRIKTCKAFIDFAMGQHLSVRELLDKINWLKTTGRTTAVENLLITSVHRSKGLEWPLVVLAGLEEGSFPFYTEQGGREVEVEDERRLFYVAMTRAIEKVVFIHPEDARLKRCHAAGSAHPPELPLYASRFLYEANPELSARLGDVVQAGGVGAEPLRADDLAIARQYLQALALSPALVCKRVGGSSTRVEADTILDISEIVKGMEVFHRVYGPGKVIAILDQKQGRLKVQFADHGETILLAAYAKLQPI